MKAPKHNSTKMWCRLNIIQISFDVSLHGYINTLGKSKLPRKLKKKLKKFHACTTCKKVFDGYYRMT